MLRNILVPLDGSDMAEEAIGVAAAIARASRAKVDLFMVHEPLLSTSDDPTWTEKRIAAEQRYLRVVATELQSGANVASRQTLVRGNPAELIAQRAVDCGADLIVMTSHGRTGWSRAWLGSVADAVMRGSGIPVLVLRPAAQRHERRAIAKPFDHVVVPLDGSAVAMEILGSLRELSRAWPAKVDLIRVVQPVPMIVDATSPLLYDVQDLSATEAVKRLASAELDRDATTLRNEGIDVGEHIVVVSPRAAQAIADYARAREANLIAMATHGRGRSRLLIGSVAEKVRRATDLPVLLHRPRFARATQVQVDAETITEQMPALAGMSATR